jgi:hypothetical protein
VGLRGSINLCCAASACIGTFVLRCPAERSLFLTYPRGVCILPGVWAFLPLLVSASLGGFDSVAQGAAPVSNLGRFLEAYVGDCESEAPDFDRTACENRAKDERKSWNGKTLRIEFQDVGNEIRFKGWDARQNAYRLDLTPVFSERGLALSFSQPRKLNSEGFPIVKIIPVWIPKPEAGADFVFERNLDRAFFRIVALVQPQGVWRFSAPTGAVRGAHVKLLAYQLRALRGDAVLVEKVL